MYGRSVLETLRTIKPTFQECTYSLDYCSCEMGYRKLCGVRAVSNRTIFVKLRMEFDEKLLTSVDSWLFIYDLTKWLGTNDSPPFIMSVMLLYGEGPLCIPNVNRDVDCIRVMNNHLPYALNLTWRKEWFHKAGGDATLFQNLNPQNML